MTLTFAGELTKMIDAGLGLETEAPDTSVAVGRYSEYIEVSDAALATFDTNAALPLRALTVNIEPVQEGTGDPSPENVRPISGRQSVDVVREGKNWFNSDLITDGKTVSDKGITFSYDADTGNFTVSGTAEGGAINAYIFGAYSNTTPIFTLPAGTYTLSVTSGTGCVLYSYDGTNRITMDITDSGNTVVLTASKPMTAMKPRNKTSGTTYSETFKIQIEKGSNKTAWVPYQGQTIAIPLGQTVYGGVLDATSGTLTVTMANIASYDGETLPGKWISDRDVYAPDTTPTTGAQVVYELAEPVEVEVTSQQLETLIGTNNVWSDGGNVSLTYTKYNYTEGY